MSTLNLTLLHTNDLHGRVEQVTKIGTLVRGIRREVTDKGGHCLYLDAGDCEDTILLESALTKGSAMDAILRSAGCDHVALGNAIPFRYGIQAIQGLADSFGKPILCGNMHWKDGSVPAGLRRYVIETLAGFQIAIIGLTAPMDPYNIFNVQVEYPETALPGLIDEAKADGARLILVVSHCGKKNDVKLAETVRGIDVLIGGHSHDRIEPPLVVNGAIITQAGQYGEVLGRIDLEIDTTTGNILQHTAQLIPVEQTIPADAQVLKGVDNERKRIHKISDIPLGTLEQEIEFIEGEECRAGNLLADALLEHFQDAQVSFVMGMHWEEGLKRGILTKGELFSANRSTGNPGRIRVTGRQLEHFLLQALQQDNITHKPPQMRGRMNGMPHVAGMQVVAYGEKPDKVEMFIGNRRIQPDEQLIAATSDYEISEILNFLPIPDDEVEYDLPTILPEVLETYIRRHTPLKEIHNGRITFIRSG